MPLFDSPAEQIPPPGGGEFWSRVVASTPLVRLNPGISLDDEVFVDLEPGGPYAIRGIYWFTAEAGGPSLEHRIVGPALFNPGGTTPANAMNIRKQLAAGGQDNTSIAPAFTAELSYDVATISTVWNTGGPARALGFIALDGVIQVSAFGSFGISWDSNSGLWALTRLAGSYLEYAPLF